MNRRKALLVVSALLTLAFVAPVIAVSTYTVQVSDSMSLAESVAIGSHLVVITEATTSCFYGNVLLTCSPLALTESVSFTVSSVITTITSTITSWLTITTGSCTGCTQNGSTPFYATLTGLIIPALTLAMYLSIAFAMGIRSFPIIVVFGAVGFMTMASAAIVPGWTVLLIVIALAATTAQTLGHFIPMNPLYATMIFLLLLGSFMQVYASSSPNLVNPSNQGQQSNLPCIGNIFGYCIVSDIINGLSSALSIAGDLGGNPLNVAVALGFIFLVVGVVAGIFGFGSLMNVVFSVGLSLSIFFYVNAELSLFAGIPSLMYILFNAVIGVADLYMFREAFSGVGGGGGGKVGTSSSSGAGAKAPVE